jgi:hypothetical protein
LEVGRSQGLVGKSIQNVDGLLAETLKWFYFKIGDEVVIPITNFVYTDTCDRLREK